MLSPGLFMVHDATRGSQDDIPELSRWEEVVGPLLNVTNRHVKSGRDDAALVKATCEVDNDLARPVVINHLKQQKIQ